MPLLMQYQQGAPAYRRCSIVPRRNGCLLVLQINKRSPSLICT